MNDIVVCKIGGSLITNKNDIERLPFVDFQKLDVIFRNLKEFKKLIVVFGVGSFGHQQALKLGLTENDFVKSDGVCDLVESLSNYYNQILSYLDKLDINYQHISIRNIADLNDLELLASNLINNGCIPICFGSIIEDNGYVKIVSSDYLAAKLAASLNVKKLVFYSVSAGVEMSDLTNLNVFTGEEVSHVISNMLTIPSVDATGGMQGKLAKILYFGFKNAIEFRSI